MNVNALMWTEIDPNESEVDLNECESDRSSCQWPVIRAKALRQREWNVFDIVFHSSAVPTNFLYFDLFFSKYTAYAAHCNESSYLHCNTSKGIGKVYIAFVGGLWGLKEVKKIQNRMDISTSNI